MEMNSYSGAKKELHGAKMRNNYKKNFTTLHYRRGCSERALENKGFFALHYITPFTPGPPGGMFLWALSGLSEP
jgi:hypothetical protein